MSYSTFGAACFSFNPQEITMFKNMLRINSYFQEPEKSACLRILDKEKTFSTNLYQTKESPLDFTYNTSQQHLFNTVTDKGKLKIFHWNCDENPLTPSFYGTYKPNKQKLHNHILIHGKLLHNGQDLSPQFFNNLKKGQTVIEASCQVSPYLSSALIIKTLPTENKIEFYSIGNVPIYFLKITGSILAWTTNKDILHLCLAKENKRINAITKMPPFSKITINYDKMTWKHEPIRVVFDAAKTAYLDKLTKNTNTNKKNTPIKNLPTETNQNGTMMLGVNLFYRALTFNERTNHPEGLTCISCGKQAKQGDTVYINTKTQEILHSHCSMQQPELYDILKGRQ